jgi:CelD/BcsL family acetyltransferase involved in cellulose biosynthesis
MLEYRWVRTWWHFHRGEGRLLLIVVRDPAGQAVGLAPLYLRQDRARTLRTIHFLGTGERERDEVAGEYLSWLAPTHRVEAVTRVVGRVLRDNAQAWDRLRLVNAGCESGVDGLSQELAPVATAVALRPRAAFRIAVQPSDEYVAALPSANFRHRCRRALRAGREAQVELVTPTRPEEVQKLFDVLTQLHQHRWRARGRPGAFASPVFRDFHALLSPGYVADGTAWLAGLRQGERWLAARYHLRAGDRVFDYVSGVDTGAGAALGPGLLLTLHALDWCAHRGVTTYDLFAGDHEYKRHLATEIDQVYELDVFARTLAAQLWLAARRLRAQLRAGALRARPQASGLGPRASGLGR